MNWNCYIAAQDRKYDLPDFLNKDNTLFYPEKAMTLHDMIHSGKPNGWHIVTDCPFLVGLYKREEVFLFNKEEGKWENPYFQTYATSYEILIDRLWGFSNSIPIAFLDKSKVTNVMGHPVKK